MVLMLCGDAGMILPLRCCVCTGDGDVLSLAHYCVYFLKVPLILALT